MRARACIKCREYVIIHPNNPLNQETIKLFEGKHRTHTLITLDLEEVRGQYTNFQKKESSEEEESD
ncbi:MAG: hypothetical protein EU529_07775 [Promethearchaeota archaeon]|nr:MAG: hypothetical protein EU529_07775 [Candidatus Lokiarchaeota archaeon]